MSGGGSLCSWMIDLHFKNEKSVLELSEVSLVFEYFLFEFPCRHRFR